MKVKVRQFHRNRHYDFYVLHGCGNELKEGEEYLEVQTCRYFPGINPKGLCNIIFDKEDWIDRCAALVDLLVHQKDYFMKMTYEEKLNVLEPFFVCNTKILHGWNTFGRVSEYCVSVYIRSFDNDTDIIMCANMLQRKYPEHFTRHLCEICNSLKHSEEAYTFLRTITKNGSTSGAIKLATFQREEDVFLLSRFFMNNLPMGRYLAQFTTFDTTYESVLPSNIWKLIFSELPAKTKICARMVCKTMFNELSSSDTWERMCAEENFIKIPRFSWLQSYFMQEKKMVLVKNNKFMLAETIYYNTEMAGNIIRAFPHPFFFPLLFLNRNISFSYIVPAVVAYPPECILEFLTNTSFFTKVNVVLYFAGIKARNLHLNPIFFPYFIDNIVALAGSISEDLLNEMLAYNRDMLIRKLYELANDNRYFSFFLNEYANFVPTLLRIIQTEPKLYNVWKDAFISSQHWNQTQIIIKFTHTFIDNEKMVVEIMTEKLRRSTYRHLISDCFTSLAQFPSGIHVLAEFVASHPENLEYHQMMEKAILNARDKHNDQQKKNKIAKEKAEKETEDDKKAHKYKEDNVQETTDKCTIA